MKLAQGALLCALISSALISYGQNSVGIGVATPNKNAVLELISPNNNQGLLIPKMTTAQRTATSFTNALTTKENGLLVFDSSDSKFYYWDATAWKEFGGGSTLTGGDGVTIINNTISTIPQDLELVGNTLSITNNPSSTPIDLSPFAGVNTDDQTLSYNAGTGQLSISRITGGPQIVTLTTSGVAGGDLTGNYPSPTVTNNAITSAKIADGTITSADILDGTITSADINDNTITTTDILDATIASLDIATGGVASVDILDQTIVAADIADNAVAANHILDGTIGTADIATGGVASVDILDATIVSADVAANTITGGNVLDGSIAGVDLANNSILSANILDGTIASADIAANTITSGNILDATITGTDIADGSVALADIAADAVNSAKIADGSIVNADISNLAAIDVAKLLAGANGQVLTTAGVTVGWANPSGSTLINNVGTRNLFGGNPVGSPGGTSADNTFFGWNAGAVSTTGSWNVAIGSQAGQNNVVGGLNVLIGWRAGFGTASGLFNGNTFVGAQAGQVATSGPNTFIGEKSGLATSNGTQNVFVGNSSGLLNNSGAQNTFLGYFAGDTNTGGQGITTVGYNSDVSLPNLTNATAIGSGAIVDADNKVRIGNTAVTVIQGQVAFTNVSDRRFKTNIAPIASGLDVIMNLKPVSYNMKNSADTRLNWGFIAQDVEQLVGTNNAVVTVGTDKDRSLGLRYSDFVAPLVKAVQEQQDQISDLNSKLSESEKKYQALAAELEQIKRAIGLKADAKK